MDRQQLIRPRRVLRAGAIVLAFTTFFLVAGLRLAGWQPLVEQSGSMAPTYARGDLLLVSQHTARAIRPGEVVTFADPHHPGRTLTHRALSVRPQPGGAVSVTTRGDANRGSETWTTTGAGRVGRVRFHLALPEAISGVLAPTPLRAIVAGLLTLVACALSLRAIWSLPAAACELADA